MIVIDENYGIETDSFGNFTLFRKKTVKTGKTAGEEVKENIGYYSTLKGALNRYIIDRFNFETENETISVSGAISRLEAIEKDIFERVKF